MPSNPRRPRAARFNRVLLAGVLVAAYGVNACDVARSAIPPPVPDRADHPRPHQSADGGLPLPLVVPPAPAEGPPPAHVNSAPTDVTADAASGIPEIVLDAYRRAGQRASEQDPSCRLPWQLLAAIGKVESGHAEGGAVDSAGTALRPILGPPLDGTNGYAAISNGAGWARAMGPMQFIPSTWNRWAVDGNGDGRADPENVYDATAAAADYLCADGRDLSTQNGLTSAILSYNDSARYLTVVWSWYQVYRAGVAPTPDLPGGLPATDVAVVLPAQAPPTPTQSAAPPSTPPVAPPPSTTTPAPPTTPPPTTPVPPADPVTGIVEGLTSTVTGTVAGVGSTLSGLLGPAKTN